MPDFPHGFIDRLAERFAPALVPGSPLALPLMPSSAEALLALALRRTGRSVLLITDGLRTLDIRHQDLTTLAGACPDHGSLPTAPLEGEQLALRSLRRSTGPREPSRSGRRRAPLATPLPPGASLRDAILYFPPGADDKAGGDSGVDTPSLRTAALMRLAGRTPEAPPLMVVTCVQAVMQPLPRAADLRHQVLELAVDQELELDDAAARLHSAGYAACPQVQQSGQLSRRGGLLDVWPVNRLWPVRIEFDGPLVASIREFDPWTQKSRERPDSVSIGPATSPDALSGTLADYLPAGTVVLWSDRDAIARHAETFERSAREDQETVIPYEDLRTLLLAPSGALQVETGISVSRESPAPCAFDPAGTFTAPIRRGVWTPDEIRRMCGELVQSLARKLAEGYEAHLYFASESLRDHFGAEFARAIPGIQLRVGELSEGFVCDALRTLLLTESDIYGPRETLGRRYDPLPGSPRPSMPASERLTDLASLDAGDLVVHVDHGIGRFKGLDTIEVSGEEQEVISIEYAEGAVLHVPTAHAHLLTRYMGVSGAQAELHRLGGRRWTNEKADAERAVADLAASLLETQAHRSLLHGHAFPPDAPWQREFEAAFPYRETPDQVRVIAETKADMESEKPMDRLVCGDAGYGKTEVAMRCAFKAVMDGRQVAILVPTTVLAQQHFTTFSERMAAYPFRIEMLSRFVAPARRSRIIAGLADGSVDIVIGTHALLNPRVRFANLGLAVIDEEQRFGVLHKERLKQMRRMVDVLTLTATPIPRTLYLSMTGARDMSLLQTPPFERQAIETVVSAATGPVIRHAILREINREGQVFYLYNRVMTILNALDHLRKLVPEARIDVAHGQMSAGQLKDVMKRFVAGEFDVLLCTTIIESGVDIPRANTILIDRADRFGIADLYQLRGRVGRANRKAYAYFLLPPHGVVDSESRQRLAAIRKHGGLGGGFALALRDLEIRGAGNLLGREQSGYIAAVGFGLYCQLLKRTVSRMRGERIPPVIDVRVELDFLDLSPRQPHEPGAACVPYDFIPEPKQRLEVYRRLAEVVQESDVAALEAEVTDRFGRIPDSVRRLLKLAALRVLAHRQGLTSIQVRDAKLMLTDARGLVMSGGRFPRLSGATPDERLEEMLTVLRDGRCAMGDRTIRPPQ